MVAKLELSKPLQTAPRGWIEPVRARVLNRMALLLVAIITCATTAGCKREAQPSSAQEDMRTALAEFEQTLSDLRSSTYELNRQCRVPAIERAVQILRSAPPTGIKTPIPVFAAFVVVNKGVRLSLSWLETGYTATGIRFETESGVSGTVSMQWGRGQLPEWEGTAAHQPVYRVVPPAGDTVDPHEYETDKYFAIRVPKKMLSGWVKVYIVYDGDRLSAPVEAYIAPDVRPTWTAMPLAAPDGKLVTQASGTDEEYVT